ncbi:MAG: hypothetical protein AAFY71_09370 [Bacteroidota bacterium]
MRQLILTVLGMMSIQLATAQIPEKWVQHTVSNILDISVEQYWEFREQVNLESIANNAKYQDLPKIEKTTAVKGDFKKAGDSRRVHFASGETLLETILVSDGEKVFAYELTEVELPLKRAAHRARGMFELEPLENGQTKITWTYGFDQKNFLTKSILKRYVKRTHQHWMTDTLAETKRQMELLARK